MKKLNAFTLAEVLITLAIIGVVAAMTIPSVIVRTNQQEFRTGAKKALSTLSSAVQLVEAQDGISLENYWDWSNAEQQKYINALTDKLNIIKTDSDADGNLVFYTADGFRYHMVDADAIFVDVNGDKGPTTIEMGIEEWPKAKYANWDNIRNPEWPYVTLTDTFVILMYSDGGNVIFPFYTSDLICGYGPC